MLKYFQSATQKFLRSTSQTVRTQLFRSEHIFMITAAIIIGILGGFGAIGFRKMIQLFQKTFWQVEPFSIAVVQNTPPFFRLLIPALGGLLCGTIVYKFAREARGHGVPEVMEAVALRSGKMRPRVVVVKALASAISIASGGSVGREGPIVQIGSALGSSVGQLLRVTARQLKTLVGCGAAAGIAATFNAPIAGALFAAEVILGDFGVVQFSPIVISSVTATVLSRHFMGNLPAFEIPPYELISAFEFLPYLILGIGAGLIAVLFNISIHKSEELFDRVPISDPIKAAVGGLIIGGIAFAFPHIHSVGYETITAALLGTTGIGLLAALIFAKIIATSVTIGSGGSGGIFAPSLFIGAMLGGLIGKIAHLYYPAATAGSGAYALVGMGAVVAAATHAPISAIIIIFELTNTYQIIAPLMVSCIISVLLAGWLKKESIYTDKLVRRGVNIRRGQDINILKNIPVKSIVRSDILTLPETATLSEIIQKMLSNTYQELFIVNAQNEYRGHLSWKYLARIARDETELENLVVAADIARTDIPTVCENDHLDMVMNLFARYGVEELPVIARNGRPLLIGSVHQKDVIEAYNREIQKIDLAGSISGIARTTASEKTVKLSGDVHLHEIEIPRHLIGKTIRETDIRKRYQVQIVLIKRTGNEQSGHTPQASIFPDPDYRFDSGDHLLVLGSDPALRKFQENRTD